MSEAGEDVAQQHRRWLTYAAVAITLVYLAFMLVASDGHFVPQVIDLYVVCQYAKAFAEGHPFQYNPGDPASTGSTSLLFTLVLGLAHALGARGEGLVAFAIFGGAACYIATVRMAYRLAEQFSPGRDALLAGGLVVLGGPLVWGFLYGSDIAPYMLLFLWLTDRLFAGSVRGVVAVTTVLALTRPEGLPIAAVLAAASRWLWPGDRRARWLAVPIAAGASVFALYRLLTGLWVSTSMVDKSLLANYSILDATALACEYAADVLRGVLLGLYPSSATIGFAKGWAPYYFAPMAVLLVIPFVAQLDAGRRRIAVVWGVVVVLLFVLVSSNMYMGTHFNRYLLWAFPSFHVFTALGLSALTRRLAADAALERRLFAAGAVVLLAFGAISTLRFASLYGEFAGQVYRRDFAAARWIARNLPRGVPIANLVTSIEYLTGHRNLNFEGVLSASLRGYRRAERELAIFEGMGHLAETDPPHYLLTTARVHETLPALGHLVEPEPVYTTTSFVDELVLYRMRLEVLGRRRKLLSPAAIAEVRGLTLVDELNVGDVRDERGHDYVVRSRVGHVALNGTVRWGHYPGGEPVIDGGRAVLGSESFDVAARRGKDLVLVMRSAPSINVHLLQAHGDNVVGMQLSDAVLHVIVEGRPYRELRFTLHDNWNELVARIGGEALGAERTRLELRGRYASFYYWFFQ